MGKAGSYFIRDKRVPLKTDILQEINGDIVTITIFPSPQFFNPRGIERNDQIFEGRKLIKWLDHLKRTDNSRFRNLVRHLARNIHLPIGDPSRIRPDKPR